MAWLVPSYRCGAAPDSHRIPYYAQHMCRAPRRTTRYCVCDPPSTGRMIDSSPDRQQPMNALDSFHPAVSAWFLRTFDAPTPAQEQAWPALQAGRHVLVAAPTGSGKTFAAFLAAIDQLVKEGLSAPLPDETRIVYVSPLKALSNDIQRNLEAPLKGIREELAALNLPDVEIRAVVRTGDTSQAERAGMRRRAPHIVVTTPESLYILLGSQSGRDMLSTCRTPAMVFMSTGKKAPSEMRKKAGGLPRPNQRMARGM